MTNNSYLGNVCLTSIGVYLCVLFDTYDILLLIRNVVNMSNFYYFENLYAYIIHYRKCKSFHNSVVILLYSISW